MKNNIKLTTQNIFKTIFIIMIIVNLVILFFVFVFIKSQVYDTMFMSREDLLKQSNLSVEDIDIDKFNNVIDKIDKKNNLSDIQSLNDIFY